MSNNVMKKKPNLEEQERTNDTMINRLMLIFIGAVVAITSLLLIKKQGNWEYLVFYEKVIPILWIISGVGFAAAIVYFFVQRARHADESKRIVTSVNLLGLSSIFLAVSLLYRALGNTKIVVGLIVLTILYFVFYLYQRDFFYYSVLTAAGTVLLYLHKNGGYSNPVKNILLIGGKVASIALPILVIAFLLLMMAHKGAFPFGERKIQWMKPTDRYYPFFVSAGILLAGAVLAFLISGTVIYSVITLLASYLVIAIIYTVKMI